MMQLDTNYFVWRDLMDIEGVTYLSRDKTRYDYRTHNLLYQRKSKVRDVNHQYLIKVTADKGGLQEIIVTNFAVNLHIYWRNELYFASKFGADATKFKPLGNNEVLGQVKEWLSKPE